MPMRELCFHKNNSTKAFYFLERENLFFIIDINFSATIYTTVLMSSNQQEIAQTTFTSKLLFLECFLFSKKIMREKKGSIGSKQIPVNAFYGIHSIRASENFTLSNERVNLHLTNASQFVKKAAAETNY